MSESAAFYEEILYPLQTGVLSALASCSGPFYLTGGAALHRHYFSDRYSDDLDLFAEREPEFATHVERAFPAIEEAGYFLAPEASFRRTHFRGFPPDRFDSVRWRRRPDRDRFLADLARIADDLLEVRANSLAPAHPEFRIA